MSHRVSMQYSDVSSGESCDEFDSSIHHHQPGGSHHLPPHRPTHAVVSDADAAASIAAQPKETSQRWLNWYMGAPGTFVGTLVGLCIVEGVRVAPAVKRSSQAVMYDIGDAVHTVGALYFRALTFMTLPLAFLTIALSVADMMMSKRMFRVRWKLVGLTLLTTLLAIGQALVAAWLLGSRLDSTKSYEFVMGQATNTTPVVAWQCPNVTHPADGLRTTILVAHNVTNDLQCVPSWGPVNGSALDERLFLVTGIASSMFANRTAGQFTFDSMSAEIINTLVNLSPSNMMDMVLSNNVVGLVVFAVFFGQAAAIASSPASDLLDPIQFMRELHAIFKTMLSYVVTCTPLAIVPLFAGPFLTGTQTARDDFPRLGYFILAFAATCTVHVVVVLPAVLFLCTRTNPYKYLYLVRGALVFGLGCSSSSTSLPLAIRLMDGTNSCDRNIARFAGSIGTGINKNGAAMYIVLALVWTIRNAGIDTDLSVLKYGILSACALVASLAVAPVRTGGLAVVLCVFRQVTGLDIVPYSLSFMVIAECIVDPMSTVVNLWGNLVVSRIVAHRSK
ncbi:hypothetical protein DYB37_008662 [Aphanomyces astaci]|uniref:Amino acid transporter n=1 Tax=Aphanomyces astaci TaxID=112090 RepID=A0A3R7A7E2_APHAT|nr:hypothetical protein DYB35_006883 [Aphanomyces astaci]RHZ15841.1 hypothetical protein DYB37_008662 [Aphanomyces astaci]